MNNLILRDEGFKYYCYGQGARGNTYWKCSQFYRTFCLAKVRKNGGRIISRYEQHNHTADAAPINIQGKNSLKLREGGFTYRCNGQTACGTIYWRCKEFSRMHCPARVKTNGNQVVLSRSEEHNHNPDGAPKVDTETREAGNSTTDAPEPPGSGSQNEITPVVNQMDKRSSQCPKQENVDQNCYGPSGHTKPQPAAASGSMMNANTEVTSSHLSHTTYAQWPGQAGANQDEQLDLSNRALDAREDAQINVEANVREVTFTPLSSDSTFSSLYSKLQTIYEYLQTNTEDNKPIMPDESE